MKRTKQAYFRPNPSQKQTQDSSGVTFLIGEDHPHQERTKQYQKLQREYLDEQMREKKQIQQNIKTTNHMFDQQLLENTRHRAQLETYKHDRLTQMEKATDDYNTTLANERRNRQKQEKQRQIQQERRELELLNQRKIKRVLPNER